MMVFSPLSVPGNINIEIKARIDIGDNSRL